MAAALTLLLALLLPVLIGLAAVALFAGRQGLCRRADFWTLAWAAPGLGMGFSSVLFFLWSLVFYPRFAPGLYIGLEVLVLLGLSAAASASAAVRLPVELAQPGLIETLKQAARKRIFTALLALAFAASAAFFAYRFLAFTAQNPLGGWDAWAIWNYKARFLLEGDPVTWKRVFAPQATHPDYPFLLSGFIARCWVLIGKDRAAVPALTAALFSFSTVGLLTAAVTRLRGLNLGLLAGTLLMSLPVFTWTAASQYADLPLAFYFLAALVCILLYFNENRRSLYLPAAGIAAGFALWTKNEGTSFALAAGITLAAVLFAAPGKWKPLPFYESKSARIRPLLLFAAGLLPALLLYAAFKGWMVPPTDLFNRREPADYLLLAGDPNRWRLIAQAVWDQFLHWGGWRIPFLPALGVFLLAAGPRLPRESRAGVLAAGGILALTYAQYMAIYLITPHDLAWHMQTSIGRLYNQLLPGALLVLMCLIRKED